MAAAAAESLDIHEDAELTELSQRLQATVLVNPSPPPTAFDINDASSFHVPMPGSSALRLRMAGVQQHTKFSAMLARLQDEQRMNASEEQQKVSTEPPASEVGWANVCLLRWTDIEHVFRTDPAATRWLRPEVTRLAKDRFKIMEFSEFRYLLHKYYKHYALYPQYNTNMTQRFFTDQDRRAVGVNMQYAALLLRLRPDMNSADVLADEAALATAEDDASTEDKQFEAEVADAVHGRATKWRLYYAPTDTDHTLVASPDLEQQLKHRMEVDEATKSTDPRYPYKHLLRGGQRLLAWHPTPLQFVECPVSYHLSGTYVSWVQADKRREVCFARLPQCRTIRTLSLSSDAHRELDYEVVLHLVGPPHGVLFVRYTNEQQQTKHGLSEYMLHYFTVSVDSFGALAKYRFGIRLGAGRPTCLHLCSEIAVSQPDVLYWGSSDCGTYSVRLPHAYTDAPISSEQLDLQCSSLWATDEEETKKTETDGFSYSTKSAEPPRNLFVAPCSRHACQTSASNVTFVVRRPLLERISLPAGADVAKRKELEQAFVEQHVQSADAPLLAPLPVRDWSKHSVVFQRDSISVISSAIVGNLLVVHDAMGNVVFAPMMGAAPGRPLSVFQCTKAGLPLPGLYTGTYQSVAASIGRVVVLQPNGLLVFIVPLSLDEVRSVLQAKEQLAVEEEYKHIMSQRH